MKSRLDDRFAPGIRDGIRQHRRIDAFTDAHPRVAAFRHGAMIRIMAPILAAASSLSTYSDLPVTLVRVLT